MPTVDSAITMKKIQVLVQATAWMNLTYNVVWKKPKHWKTQDSIYMKFKNKEN